MNGTGLLDRSRGVGGLSWTCAGRVQVPDVHSLSATSGLKVALKGVQKVHMSLRSWSQHKGRIALAVRQPYRGGIRISRYVVMKSLSLQARYEPARSSRLSFAR